MAILAGSAELSAMGILAGVTAGTITRDTAEIIGAAVTTGTRCPKMPAGKREIGQAMIECGTIERNQSRASALVLAMARFARPVPSRTELAVESRSRRYVSADAFMARRTAAVLRFLAERRVAAVALAFQVGVRRAERAWRNQPLHHGL